MKNLLLNFRNGLLNLLTSGVKTLEPRDRRRLVLINGILLIGVVVLSLAGASALFVRQKPLLAAIDLTLVVLALGCLIWLRIKLHIRQVASVFLVIMGGFFMFLLVTGGDTNTGPLWTYLFPLFAFFLLGTKLGWLLTLTLWSAAALLLFQPELLQTVYEPAFRGRFLGSLLTLTGIAYLYEASRKEAERRMQAALKETDDIFQAIREGLFLILKIEGRYVIGNKSSHVTESLFSAKNIAGTGFLDRILSLSPQIDVTGVEKYLGLLFNIDFDESMLEQINPLRQIECHVGPEGQVRFLSFGFYRVVAKAGTDKTIASLMCTVIDETDALTFQKKLAEQEQEETAQTQLLLVILNIEPFLLKNFLQKTRDYVKEINELLRDANKVEHSLLDSVYRKVHSVKGDAGALGLRNVADAAHSAEKTIEVLKAKPELSGSDLFPFLTELTVVGQRADQIAELQARLSQHYHKNFETMVNPLKVILNKLHTTLSAETQKPARLRLMLDDMSRIPKKYHDLIQENLVQLLRNSFMHGIETPEQRKALHKPETGSILIKSETLQNLFRLTYQDDGAGLDLQKLRQKAVGLGLATAAEIENWPEKKVRSLIFTKGFSTADAVSQNAGRGIGMDIIYENVKSMGGQLKLRTTWHKGIEFVMEFELQKTA